MRAELSVRCVKRVQEYPLVNGHHKAFLWHGPLFKYQGFQTGILPAAQKRGRLWSRRTPSDPVKLLGITCYNLDHLQLG